tara:strand:+ start:1364 stop:2041 length:678 start_codon:yes stop_codon:yes gene_type:complete
MESFKYYKRGQGELDTSNFNTLLEQGSLTVETLDSKTFVSLLAFNSYIDSKTFTSFNVLVKGYVEHMRGDKDLFSVSSLYLTHLPYLNITCAAPQHESTAKIVSAKVEPQEIVSDLEITPWYTQYVGADSSVCKFFPRVDVQAQKVRLDGKVLSNQLEKPIPQRVNRVVIVDDILGGGATVRMLVESLRKDGFTGEIYLWVRYNEAIHTEDFIDLFKGVYLGDTL